MIDTWAQTGGDVRTDDLAGLVDRHLGVDGPADGAGWAPVVRGFFAAVAAKNLEALCALMTEDCLVELPFTESGRTDRRSIRIYSGTDEVRDFWSAAFAGEGVTHGIGEGEVSVGEGGTRVFVEFTAHLTMESGREYRNRYVLRFDLRGERIALYREYYNPIQSAYAFDRPIAGHLRLDSL